MADRSRRRSRAAGRANWAALSRSIGNCCSEVFTLAKLLYLISARVTGYSSVEDSWVDRLNFRVADIQE
jgi:hypothetical protein